MKKKGLLLAALSAALIMSTGMISSWAAGWEQSNGEWVYYNSDGSLVTYDWKKGADGKWRYLDGSGSMAVNSWVDEVYYVDGDGIMVAEKWLELDGDYSGQTEDTRWYYFLSSGKAVTDTWKKLNDKWYHFSDTGAMDTGWTDDDMYFCGDDGAAKIGWQKLEPPEGDLDETDAFDEDEGRRWYYFSSSGKKYVPADGEEYGERRIDNAYYCFDSKGMMQTGWVYLGSDGTESSDIADYRFYGDDGKVRTGWYSAEPPEGKDGYEDEVEWFYFSKTGVPRASSTEDGRLIAGDILTINKKRYLFNQYGNPVYGLQKVYSNADSDEYTAYYFGDNYNDCVARTGRMKVEEGDGNTAEYYFTESGKGFTGIHSSSVYYKGKLQCAEEGLRYQVISLPSVSGGSHTNYLVNASGKIVKSTGGVKDADGVKYKTNSSGVLQEINDEKVGSSDYFTSPLEPAWS